MLHVEVVAAIIVKDSKVLVCKRPSNKPLNPLMWEFPGGKIEEGETKIEALKREIKEELSLDIEVLDHLKDCYHEYSNFTINLYTYICKPLSDIKLTEHIDSKYLTIDELKDFDLCGSDKLVVPDIIKYFNKEAGILLPLSSLPSPYGIGTMGVEAYKFVDFLHAANQQYWQLLPIGITSFGDSPYASLSTYAGGYYYIDLDFLVKDKLLTKEELKPLKARLGKINYENLYATRLDILKKAFNRFEKNKDYEKFLIENSNWLFDFSLFMAIKEKLHGASFDVWPDDVKHKYNVNNYVTEKDVEFYKFIEYLFFKQWTNLKNYANMKGIKLIGDLPIYVAYDSSDVWANPSIFDLDENLVPKKVAGVPPDYFSKTGQLWGNPLYKWDILEKSNYKWWVNRIKHTSKLFDVIRLDHFRGFAGYWSIPYGDKTAVNGRWEKGPAKKLFDQIKKELPNVEIIAEDLGTLTPDVYELLDHTNFPGMKVFQFGISSDLNSEHLPHNYKYNQVVYPGTHDNQTLMGFVKSLNKENKKLILKYLQINSLDNINNDIIIKMYKSKARLVVVPFTDFLGYGDNARINTPSTLGCNWTFRLHKNDINSELALRIKELTTYREKQYEIK